MSIIAAHRGVYRAEPICDALPTTLSRIMDIRRSGPAPQVYHPARATA
ncbi:hypothetical protein [Frigidibacter sp.]|nr:hypothetical protein [Frigidibacter sp.]MDP3342152.1 hypothetical protein [Frigidibacter sp.]